MAEDFSNLGEIWTSNFLKIEGTPTFQSYDFLENIINLSKIEADF